MVTTEDGGTATFTVRLNSQPNANVTIGLSSSDTTEGTVSPSSLTFTSANWSTAQTVTVTGVADAIVDGDVAYTIVTAPASSNDPGYNGLDPADVSVTNQDTSMPPIGNIVGQVLLQGRSDYTGAEVCTLIGTAPVTCMTTDPSGNFNFLVLYGTYTVAIEMPLYLDAQKTSVEVGPGGTVTLSPVTLKAGDVNDDDVVNILDITFIGGRYGSVCGDPNYDPRADLNIDCKVNIQDIALAGGNYQKTSPVPWD